MSASSSCCLIFIFFSSSDIFLLWRSAIIFCAFVKYSSFVVHPLSFTTSLRAVFQRSWIFSSRFLPYSRYFSHLTSESEPPQPPKSAWKDFSTGISTSSPARCARALSSSILERITFPFSGNKVCNFAKTGLSS